jgi:hypothetical protein
MKLRIPFKPKIILALLIIAIVLNTFSIFILFPRIETIIHGDLYAYGLQFSLAWVSPIRAITNLFLDCLKITIILVILSALILIVYDRKRTAVLRSVSTILVAAGLGISLFSLYPFYLINQMVNNDLYAFGLQMNEGWQASYNLYSMQLFGFIGLASASVVMSTLLIHMSARKNVDLAPENLVNSILIISGTASLALSIIYNSSILALIGLGMLSWGVILTYIGNEEYVKKVLLTTNTSSRLTTVNKVIQEADFAGNAAFLPPRYFKISETYKAYIPKDRNFRLPPPETFYRKDPRFPIEFVENPPAILITPPGAELIKLFEKTLKKNFAEANLKFLKANLIKLFIEDLEIVNDFEMNIEEKKTILFIIKRSVYGNLPADENNIYFTFISPLTSAIACVLAKSINKPIIIVKQSSKNDGATVTIEYRILEDEETVTS